MAPTVPLIMPPPVSMAQLAVLMVDGSGSMADPADVGSEVSKADAVLKATRDFVAVLKSSKIKDTFWLSTYAFSTTTTSMLENSSKLYVKVTEIDANKILNPLVVLVSMGNTDLAVALGKALETAEAFRRDKEIPVEPKYRRIVVFLLTDGLHNVGDVGRVHKIASKISNLWPLSTIAFGNTADVNLLKEIATDDRFFLQTADPDRLRAFFIHSSTLARK
jgi:uncharacterized protein YegL